jgi:L-amino acid N-acyltransferase YncA
VRRWFSGFWGSTARLGFASAAMLSGSILYFAATRPAPAPDRTAVASVAAVTPSRQEVQQQIHQAVAQAVAVVEAREAEKTRQLVAYVEHQNAETLRSARWIASESEADRKRAQVTKQMAMYVQPHEGGEVK